jgi:hypothetical protein
MDVSRVVGFRPGCNQRHADQDPGFVPGCHELASFTVDDFNEILITP